MCHYYKTCDTKRLVKAGETDLEVRAYKILCRALGMIGKLNTGPLWRFRASDKPFVEVVSVYQELTRNLGAWAVDGSDLVDGSGKPFTGAVVHTNSAVFDCLFRPGCVGCCWLRSCPCLPLSVQPIVWRIKSAESWIFLHALIRICLSAFYYNLGVD